MPVTTIIVPHHLPKTKPEKINKGRTKPKNNIHKTEKIKSFHAYLLIDAKRNLNTKNKMEE